MNSKIIGFLVIIALVLGGVYLWYQSQENTSETAVNIPSDWKTYQEGGFSFSYPPNFYFNGRDSITSYDPITVAGSEFIPKTEIKMYVDIYQNMEKSLQEWVQEAYFVEYEEINIAGEPAIRGITKDPTFGTLKGDVRIIKDGTGYRIGYWPYESAHAKVFDQLLNTFQFSEGTKSVNIPSDWVTYKNEEWGFEMKLPPNWTADEFRRTEEMVRTSGGLGKVGALVQVNMEGDNYRIAINYNSGLAGHQDKPRTVKKYLIAGEEVEINEYSYESGFSQWFTVGVPGDSYRFRVSNRVKDDTTITNLIISTFQLL